MSVILLPSRWTRQPPQAARVNPNHPFSRGLVVSQHLGNGRSRNLLSGDTNTITGTKLMQGKTGGATGFNSTYGLGSTDKIDVPYTADNAQITLFGRFLMSSYASSRVVDKGVNGGGFGGGGSDEIVVVRNYSSATAVYEMAVPPLDQVIDVMFTWDSTGSDPPVGYLNGVQRSLAALTPVSGTWVSNSNGYTIGNRSDNARCLPGWIEVVDVWHGRIFTPDEAAEFSLNPYQHLLAQRRIFYSVGPAGIGGAVSEAASADDSVSSTRATAGALTETASTTDTVTSSAAVSASLAEPASAADSSSGTTTGDYAATRNESTTAADSVTSALAAAASLSEAAAASEAIGCILGTAAARTESTSAVDSLTSALSQTASLTEVASASVSQDQAAYGKFVLDLVENNASSPWADADLAFTWLPEWRVGDPMAYSPTHGEVTLDSNGNGEVPDLPLGQSGIMLLAKKNTAATDDEVFYQAGAVV